MAGHNSDCQLCNYVMETQYHCFWEFSHALQIWHLILHLLVRMGAEGLVMCGLVVWPSLKLEALVYDSDYQSQAFYLQLLFQHSYIHFLIKR